MITDIFIQFDTYYIQRFYFSNMYIIYIYIYFIGIVRGKYKTRYKVCEGRTFFYRIK